MRGHIRKRDDRSWAVVVDVGHDSHTGKRRQKWVSVKGTKRAAERRLAEVVRDLNEGTYVEPSRVTLPDYLDRWIRDYVSVSVRERTAQVIAGSSGGSSETWAGSSSPNSSLITSSDTTPS